MTTQHKVHDLKLKNEFFDDVKSGNKNFEIRKNKDRQFQKGDILNIYRYGRGNEDSSLSYWNEEGRRVSFKHNAEIIVRRIKYVASGVDGLEPSYVILALEEV